MILSLSLIYRILRSGFLRFTCGVCWKTSSSHDWNHLVLFLGLVPIVACTDCLPDKRLANTFHRRISPRSPANFLLVVSTVHERWFVLFANHQVLYIYVKLHPPLFQPRPQGFSLFLREKPWGRGCHSSDKWTIQGRGPPKEAEAHFEPAGPNLFFWD